MDILGKQGEEASDAVRNISQRLENLESRVNALDDALQDYESQVEQTRNTDTQLHQEVKNIKSGLSGKLDEVMNLLDKVLGVQQDNIDDINENRAKLASVGSKASKLERRVSELEEKIEKAGNEREGLHDDILNLEKRLDKQEEELEQKLESEEFNAQKNHVEREISKLRSSVNYLAEKFESDEIRVE
ncbi:MAG: hypothetical protein ABEK04_03130 [Candidatus Nanohalobium sp.]